MTPAARALQLIAAAAALGAVWPTAAHAQPAPPAQPAPDDLQPDRRRFYVRAGGALIKPISSSRELELVDVDGPASLAVHDGPIAGSGARIGSAVIPAVIIGYVLPTASRRWSVEGVLGPPFTVKLEATGTLATTSLAPTALGIPTGVGPLGSDLGETTAVPLVLTATYRPPISRVVWPYIGAGPSVLFSRNAKVTNPLLTEVNQPEMTIDPAPGLVLQGGIDARISRSIYARLDIKFVAFMTAHAEVSHINVKTPGLPIFDSVEVGTAKMTVDVNPLIVQAGIGFDFDLW
ncbi:MAG TPA: OmpW family outer membrane protein [Kofleriaceae bacterium]|nr:OmpW family outer membrane protein [Kofleriaceae bacterium]